MNSALLTIADIDSWRARLVEIASEEQRLMSEKDGIHRKLEAVTVLFGRIPENGGASKAQDLATDAKEGSTVYGGRRGSWPEELVRIFDEQKGPLTYERLKEEAEQGPLNYEYAKSDKGFYHAVARLQQRGYLTKYKGWLFRTSDLQSHLTDVEAGKVADVKDLTLGTMRHSPMGDAVQDFLMARVQGALGGEVLAYLKADVRFAEALGRNATGSYNVLARLVSRGEIRKEGKIYFAIKENEPPKGGSDTEGVAPPSFERADNRLL